MAHPVAAVPFGGGGCEKFSGANRVSELGVRHAASFMDATTGHWSVTLKP
jgi:hypothetical protein